MLLYTNGCSWTYGGSLDKHFIVNDRLDDEKRLSLVWPHHLGNLLNAKKVTNLSAGCGSNSRMIRTTLDYLRTLSSQEREDTIAVMQFTEWSRFELYNQLDENNDYENIQERWLKCKVDTAILSGSHMQAPDNIDDIVDLVNRKIILETPIVWIYQTLGCMYSLKGIFETYGVKKYYFWQLGQGWNYWPDKYKTEIYENFNIIDKDKDWEYERVDKIKDTHPSLNGHKELANIIYNKIA